MKTGTVKKRNKVREQNSNDRSLALPISSYQIIIAVKKMKKNDRLAFLEDLLAATSPDYLASIREAREDYRRGRVFSHEEVFRKIK